MPRTWSRTYEGLEVVLIPDGDNYIYLLVQGNEAAVVDPAEAAPVRAVLDSRGLRLTQILVTHDHGDHIGGVPALKAATKARVVGPAGASIPGLDQPVHDLDSVRVSCLDIKILATPGHTRAHVAFYLPSPEPGLVFTGDCLFAGGCGRLFGNPAELMYQSLQKLAALPEATHVYCGHEYTEDNLAFALTVEPDNVDLQQRVSAVTARRARGEPSLPSSIGDELATNPFVRAPNVGVFAERRRQKDRF